MRSVCLAFAFVACVGPQPEAPPDPAPAEAPTEPGPSRQPVPISGGTLLLFAKDTRAAVSDPDRDRLWLFDLEAMTLLGAVELPEGSQPGRAAVDGQQRIHVVLRGRGSVAQVDPAARTVVTERAVCPEPRGVTFDAANDRLLFACQGGELVEMVVATGETTTNRLQPDLRDVVFLDGAPVVTTFRAAEVQPMVGLPTRVVTTTLPLPPTGFGGGAGGAGGSITIRPGVAWRTVAVGPRTLAMVHQRQVIAVQPTGMPPPQTVNPYATGPLSFDCDPGVVGSMLSTYSTDPVRPGWRSTTIPGALPVDVAVHPNGTEVAVAFAGSQRVSTFGLPQSPAGPGQCAQHRLGLIDGQFTGVAYAADGRLVAHSRSPAFLRVFGGTQSDVAYATDPVDTPGSRLFHTSAALTNAGTGGFGGANLACASCHPEGGEDGVTWHLDGPARRTQSLSGGLAARAPFHWQGNHADLSKLMTETFVRRMGGRVNDVREADSLRTWLDRLPAARPSRGPYPAGRAVFERAGCATCHSGPLLTNNAVVSVRSTSTEGFKVPSLIGLQARAPYMHDGCAATIRARFTDPACGGDAHGDVIGGQFTAAEVDDLIAYLESI